MSYNEDGYRIESYEKKNEEYYQIRWKHIDTPMRGIVNEDDEKKYLKTTDEAKDLAERLVKEGFGDD